MYELPSEVRCQLVDFAADVIEEHQSQIIAINFIGLIYNEEVTPSDTRLAEAICNSGQTQLRTIDLNCN